MSDTKKIVIKINRAPSQRKTLSNRPAPEQITQWNIKRIIGALLVAVLFLTLVYYFGKEKKEPVGNDPAQVRYETDKESLKVERHQPEMPEESVVREETIVNKKIERPENISTDNTIKPLIKSSDRQVKSFKEKIAGKRVEKSIAHYKVTRSLLARSLVDKEPVGEIKTSVKVNNDEATGVFYFTEIKGMKGRILYHQWLHEDRLVYKRPIKIRGNRWRASTSKLFSISKIGNWTVRLIDKDGRIYNEIKFSVIAE